jgi:hypothetical protein
MQDGAREGAFADGPVLQSQLSKLILAREMIGV